MSEISAKIHCEEICAVYDQDTLSKSTAKIRFSCFCSGNFDVKNAPHIGRPITKKARLDEIMEKVEQDRHANSHDIVKKLNIYH